MRHLLLAHDYAAVRDAQLRVAVPPGHVLRMLKLMRLDHLLPIYQSLTAALTDDSPR